MNNYDDDLTDEWMADLADEAEDLKECESSSLTWDEELVRETHREVAIRARRASTDGLFAVAAWSQRGVIFQWTVRKVA